MKRDLSSGINIRGKCFSKVNIIKKKEVHVIVLGWWWGMGDIEDTCARSNFEGIERIEWDIFILGVLEPLRVDRVGKKYEGEEYNEKKLCHCISINYEIDNTEQCEWDSRQKI